MKSFVERYLDKYRVEDLACNHIGTANSLDEAYQLYYDRYYYLPKKYKIPQLAQHHVFPFEKKLELSYAEKKTLSYCNNKYNKYGANYIHKDEPIIESMNENNLHKLLLTN